MSTDDREGLIEELGWLKVVVVLVSTTAFSLISWIVNTGDALILRVAAGLIVPGVALYLVRALRRVDAILLVLKRGPDHDLV